MAIMKSDDGKELVADCSCGCGEGLRIKVNKFDTETYSILSYISSNFYRDQDHSVLSVIGKKLKKIGHVIRGKDYCYSEILMSKQEFEEFKAYINSIE